MNWYKNNKIAQEYPPIAILSYDKDSEDLAIAFNGITRYVYPNVTPDDFNYLDKLLKHQNYKKAQEVLKNISNNRPDDKQLMLDQLYNEGHLK